MELGEARGVRDSRGVPLGSGDALALRRAAVGEGTRLGLGKGEALREALRLAECEGGAVREALGEACDEGLPASRDEGVAAVGESEAWIVVEGVKSAERVAMLVCEGTAEVEEVREGCREAAEVEDKRGEGVDDPVAAGLKVDVGVLLLDSVVEDEGEAAVLALALNVGSKVGVP